jgi:asparagine synthase (glutamine-hydrolysing)
MNHFLCALRPTGELIHKTDVFGFLARLPRDVELETIADGPFLGVAATGSQTMRPLLGRYRHLIGVGDVRLDNRAEILGLIGGLPGTASDLQLVLALLDARGAEAVTTLQGDFGFVAWDARAQKIIAARDPFGVKSLFMRRENRMLIFASRAAPLARGDEYDAEFMRDYLYGMPTNGTRTVWRDVVRMEAGVVFQQRGTVHQSRRFWSAEDFPAAHTADEAESIETFRTLFTKAIGQRIEPRAATWSQLSGGLDSSAIVATAEGVLGRSTIGGTITLVDSLGAGDERGFSDLVVQKFGLRNTQIEDVWPWQEDGRGPPVTDEPHPLYPFYARDQRMRSAVLSGDARVLLSGLGSDHYLFGNLNYIPDLVMAGRLLTAARELANWSVADRQSFWVMARRHAIAPLFGRTVVRRKDHADAVRLPRWLGDEQRIRRDFERVYEFVVKPPRGRMFSHYTARELQTISSWVQRDGFENGMEMRYPFLSRPLVEFSLGLPVHMRARPFARKWILREAMRGLVPEQIRTRQSKGNIDARMLWALQREHATLQKLLHDPISGELGLVDVHALRAAVEEARCGVKHNLVMLISALSLETWLAVRNGRTAVLSKAA